MSFELEEINEFKLEARELVETAERSLLLLDGGDSFLKNYDAIFRAFHNLKGSAGMLEMYKLQEHMHVLENTLTAQKDKGVIGRELIDYFLKGCDVARNILDGGNQNAFTESVTHDLPVEGRASQVERHISPVNVQTETDTSLSLESIVRRYLDLDELYRRSGQVEELPKLKSDFLLLIQKIGA
jgi:chemotaxis protein histidine kinase CheA